MHTPSASQAVEVAKEAVRCARKPGKLGGWDWCEPTWEHIGIPELVMLKDGVFWWWNRSCWLLFDFLFISYIYIYKALCFVFWQGFLDIKFMRY